jgi:uncharacterized protein YndB with AHSA1/START domain
MSAAAKSDLDLVVTREFEAPVDLVWEAWTRPEHLVHWWKPKGFHKGRIESLDVRPGGKWRIYMPFDSGKGGCTAYGIYREVVARERLSWDDFCDDENGNFFHKAFVTVSFEDLGGRTRVTLRARLDPPAKRDAKWTLPLMEEGWTEGWKDNLEELVHHLSATHKEMQ